MRKIMIETEGEYLKKKKWKKKKIYYMMKKAKEI